MRPRAPLGAVAATPDELFRKLDALAIETTTHEHPAVYTVEESRQLRGNLPGAHAKNLFLKDKKGDLFLIVAKESTPIDLKSLKKVIGSKHLSFGKPELLLEVLGVEPGSVTPFAVINDEEGRVTVCVEEALLLESPLNFHPLHNEATTAIRPADFVRFLEETGHPPAVITLP